MDFVQNLSNSFTISLVDSWNGVMSFLPNLVGAILFFALGWILGSLVEKLIEGLFKTFKVDSLLKTSGLEDVVERSGHKLNSGKFIGTLVKWFVIVVFFVSSLDFLGLGKVNDFLYSTINYLPRVIIAVLVLMAAVIIADAIHRIVVASAREAHVKSAMLLGSIAKWAIWIFAVLAALVHLGIAQELIYTLYSAIVISVAVAVGLAFGLGGKDVAADMLEKTIKTLTDKE